MFSIFRNKMTSPPETKQLDPDHLEQLFRYVQHKEDEIRSTGISCRINRSTDAPAIKEGNDFHFIPSQAPAVGSLIRTPDLRGTFVVTGLGQSAGRTTASTEYLPASLALFQKSLRDVSITGQALYRVHETNWRDIPAQINDSTVTIPEIFAPGLGELFLHDGGYLEIKHIDVRHPFAIITVEPWG